MANWTNAQREAIEARSCNLLISAAAGSGKTAVLVERILRLVLEDRIDIDRMLIVTFSNAAAGEMRDRILKALTEALGENPKEGTFIRRQINRVGRAYIMTLHAFCNDIVRKHFIEIGLDPSFKIGEVTTMELMKQEALRMALERAYENGDDALIYLTESYGGNRSDDNLGKIVQKLHSFIQSQPEPMKWLKEAVEHLNLRVDNFDESPAAKALIHYVTIEFDGIIHLATAGLEKCLEPEGPAEYEENFNSDLEGLETIREALEEGYSATMKAISAMSFTRLASIKKDRKMEISENLLESAKDARDQVKRKLNDLKGKYFAKSIETIVEELQFLYDKMERLAELVDDYQNQYQALKLSKNLLDFNDLEHYALKILENESICDLLREQFDYIFLDEYQDANIVQETLINRIKREDNVFLVGDVKQSIYKFRLADPSLFLDKQKRYPLEAGSVNRRIDLSMNFRTCGDVLSVVNDFFARIMSENLGEIQYDQYQYLYNGMKFPEPEDVPVEMHLIDLGEQKELDEEIQYMKTAEIEAHYVAAQIKKALGTKRYDPKSKVEKALSYGDITLLLRSTKQWANIYSDVFTQWGIPVFVDVGTSFFEALEVTILLSLLKIIDNRYRDLEWMTVLHSPLVGFDVETLAEIRSGSQETTYYEAILRYCEDEGPSAERLRTFCQTLDRWTRTATFKRLDDWLWEILDETQFYAYCGAMPEGAARQANLRLLMERAGALEGQPESGLYHFIKVIERLEKSGGDMEAAKLMPEQEDALRIMSIHKSKGLEFPLVIIGGLGKRFNLSDTFDDVMVHKALGIAPKCVDWENRHYRYTFPQLAMRKQMVNEMLSEEMRILYVALTRPVNRLWLVGSVTNWETAFKKWKMGMKPFNLAQGRSYLDWLGMYAFDEALEEVDLAIEEGTGQGNACTIERRVMGMEEQWSKVAITRVPVSEVFMEKLEQEVSEDLLAKKLYSILAKSKENLSSSSYDHGPLKACLAKAYPFSDGQLPSKISVTALKHLEESPNLQQFQMDVTLARPCWTQEEELNLAAARGTAFHQILQHIAYKGLGEEAQVDFDTLKNQLIEKGILEETVASAVPEAWLMAYTQSDMFKRIQRAKRIEKEYPFIYKLAKGQDWTLVQGIIDLYFEEEDGGVLIDFKTDSIRGEAGLKQAVESHREQLNLYSKALESIEGRRPKEVWLYFASAQRWVQL